MTAMSPTTKSFILNEEGSSLDWIELAFGRWPTIIPSGYARWKNGPASIACQVGTTLDHLGEPSATSFDLDQNVSVLVSYT
jgi:hypothetical protein